MSGYKLSRSARKELDEIWSGAAYEEGVDYAERLVAEIAETCPMLAGLPESGRLRPEFGPGLRSFPVGDYIIYYRKSKRVGIDVTRVVHGKRNQMKAMKNLQRGRN